MTYSGMTHSEADKKNFGAFFDLSKFNSMAMAAGLLDYRGSATPMMKYIISRYASS